MTCYLCNGHQRGADEQEPENSTHIELRLRISRMILGLEGKFNGHTGMPLLSARVNKPFQISTVTKFVFYVNVLETRPSLN